MRPRLHDQGRGNTGVPPMTIKLLGTTAIALIIGTGAVIAQSQPDLPQKREEAPRPPAPSAAPSGDPGPPAAAEQRPTDRLKDRAAQPEPKKEPQRGEAASPP